MLDVTYHPILFSDHSPDSSDLQFANLDNRGQKIWCLNPALLKDEAFYKQMKKHISFFLKSNNRGDVSDSILGESLKIVIRGHIISFTSVRHEA